MQPFSSVTNRGISGTSSGGNSLLFFFSGHLDASDNELPAVLDLARSGSYHTADF